jgi:DNA-binding transcriptional MerR regulator
VLLIRRIRELLYEQGFTISGARNRLDGRGNEAMEAPEVELAPPAPTVDIDMVRAELQDILALLRQGTGVV